MLKKKFGLDTKQIMSKYPAKNKAQKALAKILGYDYTPIIEIGANALNQRKAKIALVHEIQHIIQELEKFARGGNRFENGTV